MNWSKKEILANLKTSLSVNTRPWWRLPIQIRKIWIFLISHLKPGKVVKPFEIAPESFLRYVHSMFFIKEGMIHIYGMSNSAKIGLLKSIFNVDGIFFFILVYQVVDHIFKAFLNTFIFEMHYFLKWCPIFDDSPLLYQFTKYNNFWSPSQKNYKLL